EALLQFVRSALEPRDNNLFLGDFIEFQRPVARFGLLNSLSQTLCKLTAPGVPDIYQGNEIWDFSLVDPDNRRAVDYRRRRALLAELQHGDPGTAPRALAQRMEDGRAKLLLTWKTLQLRRAHPQLFRDGEQLSPVRQGESVGVLAAQALAEFPVALLACGCDAPDADPDGATPHAAA